MCSKTITRLDPARPFGCVLIETHLVSLGCVDAIEANFDVADGERITVYNSRNA